MPEDVALRLPAGGVAGSPSASFAWLRLCGAVSEETARSSAPRSEPVRAPSTTKQPAEAAGFCRRERGAGLEQVGERDVVVERLAALRTATSPRLMREMPALTRGWTCGSATTTPSIRPSPILLGRRERGAAAVRDARGDDDRVALRDRDVACRAGSGGRSARSARRTRSGSTAARSRPQSFSGFCSECACLKAKRFGRRGVERRALAAVSRAVKFDSLPARAASVAHAVDEVTVSFCRSCAPLPVPLSV